MRWRLTRVIAGNRLVLGWINSALSTIRELSRWRTKISRRCGNCRVKRGRLFIPRRRELIGFVRPIENHVELMRNGTFIAPDHQEPLAIVRDIVAVL